MDNPMFLVIFNILCRIVEGVTTIWDLFQYIHVELILFASLC